MRLYLWPFIVIAVLAILLVFAAYVGNNQYNENLAARRALNKKLVDGHCKVVTADDRAVVFSCDDGKMLIAYQ